MKKCINEDKICIGRDCRVLKSNGLSSICCYNEVFEEIELVQLLIDVIDDYSHDSGKLKDVCSKLSYAANVINKVNDEELETVLPIASRFSYLAYDCRDKIENDVDIETLVSSFIQELKKWFQHRFLHCDENIESVSIQKSIVADISTIEMALGVCILDNSEEEFDSFDDMFF